MSILGLKLWSINSNYAKIIKTVLAKEEFSYIELYALPDSYKEYIDIWRELKDVVSFKIHAPHFMHGVNFSDKNSFESNFKLIEDSFRYADALEADCIIFHPGIAGSYQESARQLSLIKDRRGTVENKPYDIDSTNVSTLKKGDKAVGAKYSEIEYILENTELHFCLDIGHAICSSVALKLNIYRELERFNTLSPVLYHLSDGDSNSTYDKHLNIDTGNYDFEKIFDIIDCDKPITIETDKKSSSNLDDFILDLKVIKKLIDIN